MNTKRILLIALSASVICFFGCKNNQQHTHEHETAEEHAAHNHEEHDHAHEGHDHEHEGHDHEHEGHNHEEEGHDHKQESTQEYSDEIIFTKVQAAKTDFAVREIQPKTFHQIIRTTGQILPAPGDESILVAPTNGTVSFVTNNLAAGSPVKSGQALFYVASRNVGEGDYYSRINASYQKAKSAYERAQALIKDRIISQKEFETIRLDYENARIAYEAISGKKSDKGVSVTAPFNGFIKNINIKDGEYVTAGQAIATISQNKRLVLQAEVSEKYYKDLKNIHSANFQTPYDNQVYALSDLSGKLLSAGKSSGDNSYFIPVTFEFDNRGDIIPGSFVEVYLISQPLENTLAVPVTALTNEMGNFYVYVQLDEEGYRKQEVKTGAGDGKEVQILSGLTPGDRVVTRGVYQVKMASFSGAIPHGHSHEH